MNFWKRRGDEAATAQTMQLRDRERHPYAGLRSFTPQRGGELRLYQAVREAVPVVDAAVCKLIRLSGGALVFCEDPETEKRLRDFLERVPAGRGQYGINAFLEQYLESLLICGGAVGEMVPAAGNRDLAALLCGRMDRIELREGESPLDFQIYGPDERGRMAALPYQELLLFTPLHPEAEHPYGVSLLRGLPFMADILMKIYNTVGVNWERCGNMRFAVTCRNGDGNAAERGQLLASEWSRAMQDTRSGSVRDFVAVGDVDIKVIGGDAPILDSQVPVRQVLEQIVAKTSIPPFMLGLNWNSTERMSAQQADMLTTEITAIRRTLTPGMEQINRFSKAELTADQVYTFSVRLCDNEVDRDFERFGTENLDRLGELFLGKSGIFDHQWSAKGQTARIYRTEVVREPGTVTAAGDEYRWLKGWAYLMRTEKNQELITEIEGGIKKEVSVGCSMGRSVCSVCGAENGACGHVKGQMYGEKLCFMELKDPKDAYEWSFVEVPAQPRAGVVKRFGSEGTELRMLRNQAELGQRYLTGLRREVVRLAMLADGHLDGKIFTKAVGRLDEAELLELKRAYEAQIAKKFPVAPQLRQQAETKREDEAVFLV